MRSHGLIVDDIPIHLAPDKATATHSIYVPQHDLRIPLVMKGIISCLPGRYPTVREIESCTWVEMTSDSDWDPNSMHFGEEERVAEERQRTLPEAPERLIYAIQSQQWEMPSIALVNEYCEDERSFQQATLAAIKVNTTYSMNRKPGDALRDKISSTFGVGLETAL